MAADNAPPLPLRLAKDLLRPAYRRLRRFVFERLPELYRDGTRYDAIADEVKRLRPERIVEIGVCRGDNAERMLRLALGYGPACYFGFDLFEEMDGATFNKESALWPATLENISARLKSITFRGRSPEVRLFKGNTAVTLPAAATEIGTADLVFIDGGHSYETVRSDWENSLAFCHDGTVIIFDDYPNWGVGPLVDEIDRSVWQVEILEPGDSYNHPEGVLNCRLARVTRRAEIK